jgi:hypothetical protein
MDADGLLDVICPGKVLRLMAADVAAWLRALGGGLEPDTAVWAELPPPWEVLSDRAVCTRSTVEETCRRLGVDPEKSGWTRARRGRTVAEFRPTPELVPGVTVCHPGPARFLRRLGAFSGKAPGTGGP